MTNNMNTRKYEWHLERTYPDNNRVWDIVSTATGEVIAPAIPSPTAERLIKHHATALYELGPLGQKRKWYHKWVGFNI
jgi:hypothetical protein